MVITRYKKRHCLPASMVSDCHQKMSFTFNYFIFNMKFFFALVNLLFITNAHAQTQFIATGKIEFEQKINMYSKLGNNTWDEALKSKNPEYSIGYFNLQFDAHQSTYKVGKEYDDPWKKTWYGNSGEDENIIYNNYDSGWTIAKKQVYEKLYKLEDSLMPIAWKITNDTRTIAGFECRKAIGKMFDTLYVVAFYTDQITTPGGPANYTGLPGMILGIGLPRFHTTLFATKLYLDSPPPTELMPPAKGKKIKK